MLQTHEAHDLNDDPEVRVLAGGLALAGGVLMAIGAALWSFFSPSPHGLLEITMALPLLMLGAALTGGGLIRARLAAPLVWLGWVLIAAAATPVVLVVWSFVS